MNPTDINKETTAEKKVEEIPSSPHLYADASLELLLNGKPFLEINGQLLYQKGGKYVFTLIHPDKDYTLEDYAELPEGAPYQLIEGKLVYMPSPYFIHQEIAANVVRIVGTYVKQNKLGKVVSAPMDVHLDDENVVQPDVLFVSISRKNIIGKHITGAPDLVVEIISKGTKKYDETEKLKVYGKHNVLEYWLIYPQKEQIKVYENEKGELKEKMVLEKDEEYDSKTIEGFTLKFEEVFDFE